MSKQFCAFISSSQIFDVFYHTHTQYWNSSFWKLDIDACRQLLSIVQDFRRLNEWPRRAQRSIWWTTNQFSFLTTFFGLTQCVNYITPYCTPLHLHFLHWLWLVRCYTRWVLGLTEEGFYGMDGRILNLFYMRNRKFKVATFHNNIWHRWRSSQLLKNENFEIGHSTTCRLPLV